MNITPTAARLVDLERLSVRQLTELVLSAKSVLQNRQIEAEAEHRTKSKTCPHCKACNVVRWGTTRGLQRWRCGSCKKTYTGLTNTPFHYTKKRGLIFALVQNMVGSSPKSCRKLSKELGVHHITVWRWRMAVTEVLAGYKKQGFEGIIEADETFFRESRKGSREWVNY